MAEYIEREATCRDCFHYDVCGYHVTELTPMTVNECSHKFVNKADVVEVVRCKECKYGDFYCSSILCGNAHAPWYNDEFDATMELDDYCSYGVRKEGAEE